MAKSYKVVSVWLYAFVITLLLLEIAFFYFRPMVLVSTKLYHDLREQAGSDRPWAKFSAYSCNRQFKFMPMMHMKNDISVLGDIYLTYLGVDKEGTIVYLHSFTFTDMDRTSSTRIHFFK